MKIEDTKQDEVTRIITELKENGESFGHTLVAYQLMAQAKVSGLDVGHGFFDVASDEYLNVPCIGYDRRDFLSNGKLGEIVKYKVKQEDK